MTVVSLVDFKGRGRDLPTLVFVDMHHEICGPVAAGGSTIQAEAIANCRAALKHARACGIPIAFTRQVAASRNMLASPAYPRWIEGFEPNRWDMVFDRQRPSCYSSMEFRKAMDDLGGNYIVAGQFGELSCLSTAIDAFHRDHRPTFLIDALVSRSHEHISAGAMLSAVTCILSLYAETASTPSWIRASSRKAGVVAR